MATGWQLVGIGWANRADEYDLYVTGANVAICIYVYMNISCM